MVVLLIVFLWLVSVGLKLIASGIDTIKNINNKVLKSSNDDTGNLVKANELANNLVKKFLKLTAVTLDVGRYLLTLLLPLVLVVDIVVATMLVSVASGYLLLLDDWDSSGMPSSSEGVSDDSERVGGKSKVLLIGDSRTEQLANMIHGMPFEMTTGPAGSTATVIGETPTGDYIFGKGSESLNWVIQVESDIDAKVDSDTAVVMNMGTNGLGSSGYIEYMNKKAPDWLDKGADVYFCTTNPVLDEYAKSWTTLVDDQVVKFNDEVKAGLNADIGWIDTYSEVHDMVIVEKKTPIGDGVHYEKEVYQKIWDVICDSVKSYEDSDGDDSLGYAVYQESLKYVGKLPYVYGGQSLDSGADCSGFIGALYKEFDHPELLTDHRTAAGLETVGKEVKDIDSAKAGDILCFRQNGEGNPSNHVAIYDGKGGMVHEKGTGYDCVHDSSLQSGLYTIRRIE